jgi:hypothetical protein
MPEMMMTDTKGTVPKRRFSSMKSTLPFVTFLKKTYLCSGQCGKICGTDGSGQLATTQKNAKSQSFNTL